MFNIKNTFSKHREMPLPLSFPINLLYYLLFCIIYIKRLTAIKSKVAKGASFGQEIYSSFHHMWNKTNIIRKQNLVLTLYISWKINYNLEIYDIFISFRYRVTHKIIQNFLTSNLRKSKIYLAFKQILRM